MNSARSNDTKWLAAVLALVALVYANALRNGFTYDDKHYVAAYTMRGPNVMVVGDHDLVEYFNKPMGYGVQSRARGFRPLTVLSYAVTHKLARAPVSPPVVHPDFPERRILQAWTDPAWPHHLINLLLHLLATWVVYRMVLAFVGPGWAALAGAAAFGLHALRSDQVVSVVGRGELLPFVFGGLGTLLCLNAQRQKVPGAVWGRYAAVFLCMLIAFLSKESAVGWAVMAPLVAATWFVLQGGSLREFAKRHWLPLFVAVWVPVLVFFVLRARMLGLSEEAQGFFVGDDNNPLFGMSLLERLPTAVMVWGYGLWKVFVPYPLSCDYGRMVFDVVGWGDWRFLLAGVSLLSMFAVGVWAARRIPLLFVGVATFLGFGFITSNIPLEIETIFGERLYYTPALLFSCVVTVAVQRWGRPILIALGLWLLGSAAVCVGRTFDWRSNETLFAADAETRPRSMGLQMNMARVSRLREDWDARERFLQRALATDPDYHPALNDLALDRVAEKRHEEALPLFERAITILREKPRELAISGVEVSVNCGNLQRRLGRFADATASYSLCVRLAAERRQKLRAARDAMLGLMWLAVRAEDRGELDAWLQRIDAEYPNDPETEIYRGARAWLSKEAEQADARFAPVLSRLPQSPHTILGYRLWIQALRKLGRDAAAWDAVMRCAASMRAQGFHRDAIELLRPATGVPKHRLHAYKLMLWSTWEVGQPEDVEPLWKQAAALAPKDGEVAAHGAMLALAAGDPRSAAGLLAQIAPKLPPARDSLRVWLAFGEALYRLGDLPRADAIARRFLSTRGISRDYWKKFRNLQARIGAPQ